MSVCHTIQSKQFFTTPIQDYTLTITSDNDKEFSYHEEIAKTLDTELYFANP